MCQKSDSFYEKVKVLHLRCVLNMTFIFIMLAKLIRILKLTKVLTKNVSQSLFVRWSHFSILHNSFLYTQLLLNYHLQENFCIIRDHIVAFGFSLLWKDIDTFHDTFSFF